MVSNSSSQEELITAVLFHFSFYPQTKMKLVKVLLFVASIFVVDCYAIAHKQSLAEWVLLFFPFETSETETRPRHMHI
jgi:hypothetical protein